MHAILIDDHQLFTELLKITILQNPIFKSVTIFDSGDDFMREKPLLNPDIIILDIRMPGTDGISVIQYCRELYKNDVKIMGLSFTSNVQIVKKALKAGANGFITKSTPIDELMTCISSVLNGDLYISENIKSGMLKSMVVENQINYHITKREKEVLEQICKGFPYKEIAYNLGIKYHTVHYYYKNLQKKLKIYKSRDLIVFAMLNGLYIPEDNL